MNRAEHLQWAKDRANSYARRGECQEAMTSFISDMKKHEQLEDHVAIPLMFKLFLIGKLNTPREMEEFINGFN